jgi:hypothetical protein
MDNLEYFALILFIIVILYVIYYHRKPSKIYFFLNNDENSFIVLNKLLKETDREIVIVTTSENQMTTETQTLLNEYNKIRPIKKVLNIENFFDVGEIAFEASFRNAKCMYQPNDFFYPIVNRLNVYGYPFDYEYKVEKPSDSKSDSMGNSLVSNYTTASKFKNLTNVPSCGVNMKGRARDVPLVCNDRD